MQRFFILMLLSSAILFGGEQVTKSIVGIDEQLGKTIPLGLQFTDEHGKKVELGSLIDKPTIFMFVYFECPGICTPLMSEVADEISKIGLKPGQDYRIIAVSFDHQETPELALKKKANYQNIASIEVPDNGWYFLTGDSNSIASLTDAVGYRFKKEGDEFIHAGGLVFVSPEGKITRYLLGTDFLPFDMKMAIMEASTGKVSPTIAKVLKFCFKYDPNGRTYVLNVTRIAGTIIIVLALGFVGFLVYAKRKNEVINKA